MASTTKKETVKKTAKVQPKLQPEEVKKETSFFDYLRFGESYTSLILGIIVVIIATALLLSFVHNKNANNVNSPISQQTQNTIQVSQQANNLAKKAPNKIVENVTVEPTATIAPTAFPSPTVKPTEKPVKPTIAVQKKVVVKVQPSPTVVSKKIVKISPKPTSAPKVKTGSNNNVWIVQKGESLWKIAEEKYSSGYNWVDIARANNLADPSDIHAGDRLILPSVTPEPSTIIVEKPTVVTNDKQIYTIKRAPNAITGKTYTVQHGDTLWNIAVRAYGDGYKWTDIANANSLANPGLIHSGNVLIIPRN